MAACFLKSISPGSSGHSRFRRVTKATMGSTTSSRYFSTTSGVWSWSQVPPMEPSSARTMEGANSFQSTKPFLMNRAVENTVPMPAESLLVPRA